MINDCRLNIADFRGVNFFFTHILAQIRNIYRPPIRLIGKWKVESGDWKCLHLFTKQNFIIKSKIKKISNLQSPIINLQSNKFTSLKSIIPHHPQFVLSFNSLVL